MKNNITQQMKDVLTSYSDAIMHDIEEKLLEVGKEAKEEFKTIGGFKDRTGKYRKSWDVRQEKYRTFTQTIVHAKAPHYRLTHLLENGHRTANGGMTREFPHIVTVNDNAQEEAVKRIIQVIENTK
ncbi:MAG: hypothetical protein MJ134_07740 [Lachnospiraceae bacterium]|nr:hypothetical protein [Lachnospiraceae bacterium]